MMGYCKVNVILQCLPDNFSVAKVTLFRMGSNLQLLPHTWVLILEKAINDQ